MDLDLPALIGAESRAERALGDDDQATDEGEENDGDSTDESAICRVEPKQPRVSEYERIKQKNIAENKIILAKIRAEFGIVKGGDKSGEKSKEKAFIPRWPGVTSHDILSSHQTFFLNSTAQRLLTHRRKRPATMPHRAPTPQ